jgi:hypothetical protein
MMMTINKINVILPFSAKAWATLLEIAIAQRDLIGSELQVNLIDVARLESPLPVSFRRRSLQRKICHEYAFNVIKPSLHLKDIFGFLFGILPDYRRVKLGQIGSIHIRDTPIGEILRCRISAAMGSRQFESKEIPIKLFLKHYWVTYAATCVSMQLLTSHPAPIYAYNGREPLAASFINIAKRKGLEVILAERGSKSSKYQIFPNSPHFHPDWWDLIEEFSRLSGTISSEQQKEVHIYIQNKLHGIDSYFDEDWGGKFIDPKGRFQSLPFPAGYVCYFSSSTTEFSPFEEYNSKLGYVDQFDAVKDLAEVCLNNNLQLVVRRHPNSIGKDGVDRESATWETLAKKFSNLIYLSPFETYNSYEIAKKASCVMVWKSSIGFETLCLRKPTYALGPAKWAMVEQVRAWNRDKIQSAVVSGNQDCQELISAYSLFMTQSGTPYSYFKDSSKLGVTLRSGKKIQNTIFERTRRKIQILLSR